jgi:hypothetical protein
MHVGNVGVGVHSNPRRSRKPCVMAGRFKGVQWDRGVATDAGRHSGAGAPTGRPAGLAAAAQEVRPEEDRQFHPPVYAGQDYVP